jgi:hypothetical protein
MDSSYEEPTVNRLDKARYSSTDRPDLAIAEAQVLALLAVAEQLARIAEALSEANLDR